MKRVSAIKKQADHQQRRIFPDWVIEMHEKSIEKSFSVTSLISISITSLTSNIVASGLSKIQELLLKSLSILKVWLFVFLIRQTHCTLLSCKFSNSEWIELSRDDKWLFLDAIDLDSVLTRQRYMPQKQRNQWKVKVPGPFYLWWHDHNYPPWSCDLTPCDFFHWCQN